MAAVGDLPVFNGGHGPPHQVENCVRWHWLSQWVALGLSINGLGRFLLFCAPDFFNPMIPRRPLHLSTTARTMPWLPFAAGLVFTRVACLEMRSAPISDPSRPENPL